MFSIIILTKNEEYDLPGCLESVNWCDDIHVFDSFSTDNTVNIALKYDAHLIQHKFNGYASQRNAALKLCKCKYPWVFFLDADERIPRKLVLEIQAAIQVVGDNVVAFTIRRKDFLNETWLKHAQITPYYIRCFRPNYISYVREINEVIQVKGETVTLKEHFEHYPFSKGFAHWLFKHNTYSTMEAARWIEEHEKGIVFSFRKAFFGSSISERRFHQKGIFYKLPGRPIIKWFYIVVGRRAILDGSAGLIYASLQSIYEYFIVLKTDELIKTNQAKNRKGVTR